MNKTDKINVAGHRGMVGNAMISRELAANSSSSLPVRTWSAGEQVNRHLTGYFASDVA